MNTGPTYRSEYGNNLFPCSAELTAHDNDDGGSGDENDTCGYLQTTTMLQLASTTIAASPANATASFTDIFPTPWKGAIVLGTYTTFEETLREVAVRGHDVPSSDRVGKVPSHVYLETRRVLSTKVQVPTHYSLEALETPRGPRRGTAGVTNVPLSHTQRA